MTNTNNFSDSQESALIDDETYHAIENHFGGTLPVPENINESPGDIPQIKQDLFNFDDLSVMSTSKRLRTGEENSTDNYYPLLHNVLTQHNESLRDEEEEDKYYSIANDILTQHDDTFSGQLNFQYSFGDGGTNQDWVIYYVLYMPHINRIEILN
ncbi:hypothetical protein HN011_006213 [Eciton burchellii]|nr:hypothetical protein HN011_006213 [Eciton burchellii]